LQLQHGDFVTFRFRRRSSNDLKKKWGQADPTQAYVDQKLDRNPSPYPTRTKITNIIAAATVATITATARSL
jgi:hypothetical protein